MTTLRIEAELRDHGSIQRVERLLALLETGNAELVRNAIDLLDWSVQQVRDGRHIASVSASGAVREFTMPLLERAREHDHITVDAGAFERVADLVANPPAPSPALRALMHAAPAAAR